MKREAPPRSVPPKEGLTDRLKRSTIDTSVANSRARPYQGLKWKSQSRYKQTWWTLKEAFISQQTKEVLSSVLDV